MSYSQTAVGYANVCACVHCLRPNPPSSSADRDAEVLEYMVSPRSGERGLPGTHNKAAKVAYARTVLKNAGSSLSAAHRQELAEAASPHNARKKLPTPRAAAGFPSARAAAKGYDDDEEEAHEHEEEGNGVVTTSPAPNGRASLDASQAPTSPIAAGTLPPSSPAISAEHLALIVAEQVQAELARLQLRSPDGGMEYSRSGGDARYLSFIIMHVCARATALHSVSTFFVQLNCVFFFHPHSCTCTCKWPNHSLLTRC